MEKQYLIFKNESQYHAQAMEEDFDLHACFRQDQQAAQQLVADQVMATDEEQGVSTLMHYRDRMITLFGLIV